MRARLRPIYGQRRTSGRGLSEAEAEAAAPSVSDGRLGVALTGGAHPSAGGGGKAQGRAGARCGLGGLARAGWAAGPRGQKAGEEGGRPRALPFSFPFFIQNRFSYFLFLLPNKITQAPANN